MRNLFQFLKSRAFFVQILLSGLAFLVLIWIVLGWLKSYTNHDEFVEVPDFSKLSTLEMKKLAREYKLDFEVLDSSNYNPEYPRFSILDQNPAPGTKVKENRKIYFTVNPSGYKVVTVPNIIQITRRNAESRLRAVGLEVERVTYIDQLGKDMVYYVKYKGKDIGEGAKLPRTSKVELVCGNGTIPGSARVQDESPQ